MARETYVMRDGRMVPKSEAAPLTPRGRRGNFPCPSIVRDEIPPTVHPATGQIMTSLSEFRKVTKASGCEEVGNEQLPARAVPQDDSMEASVAEAWDIVEQGGAQQWDSQEPETATSPEPLTTILTTSGPNSREKETTARAAAMLGLPTREAGELPNAPQPAKVPEA